VTEPNKQALDGFTPTIEFGGKQWPIPKLAIKQLRLIRDKLVCLADKMVNKNATMGDLTADDTDALATILFVALTRAHPTLTREEFDEIGTDELELVTAFFVVLAQANGVSKRAAAAGEATGPASP
jgi:hypothetical protein